MTKSDRIKALYAQGKSTREIADIVGCHDSYVRVCARQRVPGGHNPDKDYKRRMLDLGKQVVDLAEYRRLRRRAYREARNKGLSPAEANGFAGAKYQQALSKAGRRSNRAAS